MKRISAFIVILTLSIFLMGSPARNAVVADSATRKPLPGASVFDSKGNMIGICNSKGTLPYISPAGYPVTVRCMGYRELSVTKAAADTIYLQEITTELPEIIIESRQNKVIHTLAYVREYSTLTTYSDTVFLFREKMVDFMLQPDSKSKFRGWNNPRVLKSKSYYRFTDSDGLDSVSHECGNHFSWSDWIGTAPARTIPSRLRNVASGTDTIRGRYSPVEVWTRADDRISVDIDVLADAKGRGWVPELSGFFRKQIEFDNFRIRFNYDNVTGDSVTPTDISGYSFNIESDGRGFDMFRFNRVDEPFFVSTYAEVYIIDREYITVKEAKKWEKRKIATDDIAIIEPAEAPDLDPAVRKLIARVNAIDGASVRLSQAPDHRLMGRGVVRQNIGQRALALLKQLTGITLVRSHRNMNKNWKDFRDSRRNRNNSPADR